MTPNPSFYDTSEPPEYSCNFFAPKWITVVSDFPWKIINSMLRAWIIIPQLKHNPFIIDIHEWLDPHSRLLITLNLWYSRRFMAPFMGVPGGFGHGLRWVGLVTEMDADSESFPYKGTGLTWWKSLYLTCFQLRKCCILWRVKELLYLKQGRN